MGDPNPSSADCLAPERAILGAIMADNTLYDQAAELRPDDFALDAHRRVFTRFRELHNAGTPIDDVVVFAELQQHGDKVDASYLTSLTDGVVHRSSIRHFVAMVKTAAGARHVAQRAELIAKLASNGAPLADLQERIGDLGRELTQYENGDGSTPIHGFTSIPDLLTMEINPMTYAVEGLIPRRSLTLWTGIDGTAKTFLAQNMAIAVSTGGRFLGSQCDKMPVLYADYENPNFVVRDRLELMGAEPNPNFKYWGTWLPTQPPQIGNQVLLAIAREIQPLILIDPFRYSHGAEENDSTEMMQVMKDLRACVVAGATIVILHHPSKVEGSTGRGSSAIRGAVDLAYLQELSDETGLVTLRCVKNRFGERPVLTIRPDFEEGTFEVTDSPQFTKMLAEIDALSKIINESPGLSQNQVLDRWPGKRARGMDYLKKYSGSRWQRIKRGQAWCYVPPVPYFGNQSGILGTGSTPQGFREGGSPVPSLIEGTGGNLPDPADRSAGSQSNTSREPVPVPKRTELLI